ncbi:MULTISPECIES: hypothetical protein [Aerosakkonema]
MQLEHHTLLIRPDRHHDEISTEEMSANKRRCKAVSLIRVSADE